MNGQIKTPRELVRAFPFFAGLDEETYDELLARGQSRKYTKGESLFHAGDPAKGLFLVQSGSVKIFKLAESGREQIIAVQRPGDAVAEVPLFDGGPYPASAAALEDSTLLFLPQVAFHDLLLRRPQLAESVIVALARRLRTLVALIEDLSLRQVRQRLARFLLAEAGARTTFPLTLTNEEIAARLGSVRDVISRTLSTLQAEDFIRLQGRTVEVLDREGLEEAAG